MTPKKVTRKNLVCCSYSVLDLSCIDRLLLWPHTNQHDSPELKGKNTCFFEDPGARTPNMDRFWPISRKSPLETSNHPKTPKSQKKSKKKSKLLRVLDVKTVKYRCLIITVYCIQLLWSSFESGLLFKIVYRKLYQSSLSAVRGTGIFSQTMPSFFCWLFVRFLITNPESTAAIPKLQVSFLAMCLAKFIKLWHQGRAEFSGITLPETNIALENPQFLMVFTRKFRDFLWLC